MLRKDEFESYIAASEIQSVLAVSSPHSQSHTRKNRIPSFRQSFQTRPPNQADDGAFHSLAEVRSHTFMSIPEGNSVGIIVPQTVYTTPKAYAPLDTIQFRVGGTLGFPLSDALDIAPGGQPRTILDDAADRPRLSSTTPSRISLRIIWPGYDMWVGTFEIYGYEQWHTEPITRAKLAHNVANKVRQCLYEMSTKTSKDPRPDWHSTRYSFEQLVLLELRHVSAGSWQPVLAVAI
ncbi:hypothetical protein BDW22DRAFT_1423921 [Trametopsis cervina]|nr:hypothetical protein BDW22DRAFT_1423921 [Trametopsis cervina]